MIRVGDNDSVGVDRGLSAFLVAARSDGTRVAGITNPPRALATGMRKQRRLARAVSRKPKGSQQQTARGGLSAELVNTHDRLVVEDLNTAGMLRNRRLARPISDAGWAEFARQVAYKQAWRGGSVLVADR
jgi:putative transposase